ncbi:MAG: flagellar basal body-associated FliL family protein [Planctomycetota bacterium]|jgi:flagellar basal body-associated protein FliL
MADEDDAKKQKDAQEDVKEDLKEDAQEDVKTESDNKSQKTTKIGSLLPWIIMAVIIIACAGSGFAIGRLFAGSESVQTPDSDEQNQPNQTDKLRGGNSKKNSLKNWYYDELEPVVANLDEPGVTRYVRVSLTLEVDAEIDPKKGTTFIKSKKPLLKNWLAIYLASLTLEDIRGDRNLIRIQSKIRDAFNEKLFPDSKPQIKNVLIKEFAIQ